MSDPGLSLLPWQETVFSDLYAPVRDPGWAALSSGQEVVFSNTYQPPRDPGWALIFPVVIRFESKVSNQNSAIFSLSVAGEMLAPFASLGTRAKNDVSTPFAVTVAQEIQASVALMIASDSVAPQSISVARDCVVPFDVGCRVRNDSFATWSIALSQGISCPTGLSVARESVASFAIRTSQENWSSCDFQSGVAVVNECHALWSTVLSQGVSCSSGLFVARELVAPFAIRTSQENWSSCDFQSGAAVANECRTPFAIQVSKEADASCGMADRMGAQCLATWATRVAVETESPVAIRVAHELHAINIVTTVAELVAPVSSIIVNEGMASWSLRSSLARECEAPFAFSVPVGNDCNAPFDLLAFNPVVGEARAIWCLLPAPRLEVGLWD